ncbi:ABC transporter permease [Natrinema sp. CBA1119]|uniref:FtsX-like permease family protein n=1 Tax=Natrinema sp. CBA1119 TaxID=1608465 RepID=UPI000BF79FD2|nr:ABC transporter permease [Natrinema sp. CBA1119]PGF17128.1 ABC transporter permease [Natrinema sp. CBA1119]
MTVSLVALTIALLVVVTGIATGLAADSTADDEADIRVVPEGGGTLSSVVDVESARLGDAHESAAAIERRDDVAYATPVLTEAVRIRTAGSDEPETVLAMGVVPPAKPTEIEGVSTASLESGDPHYANGSYDGPRTGEIVLTDAAADGIDASAGDDLAVRGSMLQAANRSGAGDRSPTHTVTAVEDVSATDLSGELPLVVLHLSELQSMTGAEDADLADQVLVETESGTSTAAAEDAYPNATIQSGDDGGFASIRSDDFALATSLVALVVAVVICSLFVATSSALTIDRDRQAIAVLAAVGFSVRSRLAIVALTTLSLTLAGAVAGVILGIVGISLTNYVATATVAPGPIATSRPAFAPYAIGVALIAGILALPYPLYLVAQTNVVAELGR